MNELTIKINVSDDLLDSIITTAVEGGTNYWAYAEDYVWGEGKPTSVKLIDMEEYDEDSEGATRYELTRETVLKGLQTMFESGSANRTISAAVRENDGGYIDADDADNIAQYACFGKLIYG